MSVDYDKIRAENKQEYGNIARWGKGLLEGQYADRTHFIYEIAQNADDALASRSGGVGNRTLTFSLSENALSITHFGRPFNDGDVRGICGIDQSAKRLTDIGRFGIGFKSVYAYASRPGSAFRGRPFRNRHVCLPATSRGSSNGTRPNTYLSPHSRTMSLQPP